MTTSDNAGREAHNYLHFLVHHAPNDTSDFVWFSQAVPDYYMDDKLWHRLPLLSPRTGMLALSLLDRVTCEDGGQGWGPKFGTFLSQLYAMTFHEFCHDVTWTGFFSGEFIVSRRRIAAQPHHMWTSLRDIAAQPNGGWIHQALSSATRTSSTTDPVFAHLLERAWNVLFRCVRAEFTCCDAGETCAPDACQCLDEGVAEQW